ncbi:MAG: hypothetical protein QOG16_599 [Actinomycetota bacterium]|nr:hypothetical protein [Actinomycetota bacterium]
MNASARAMAAATEATIDVQINDSLADTQPKTSAIADPAINKTDAPTRMVMRL